MQQFYKLAKHLRERVIGYAGDVAARACKAAREPRCDRIAAPGDHGHPIGDLLYSDRGIRTEGKSRVDAQPHQFTRQLECFRNTSLMGAPLDDEILPFIPAAIVQPGHERRHNARAHRHTIGEQPKARRFRLRLGGKRRGEEASDCGEKDPAVHHGGTSRLARWRD